MGMLYHVYGILQFWSHNNNKSHPLQKLFHLLFQKFVKMRGRGGGSRGVGEENHNQHGWDPCRISECFASQENTKAVATLKYFITSVKFCLSYFYLKSL